MNQYQHADMYDYPADRSPNSIRGYSGVQRQTSRHFENTNYGGTQQGLYTADDHVRYDTGPQDYRTPASTIHVSQYIPPYENQTWGGYGGGINTMGGTGRMKQSQRRNPLPSAWSDNQMSMTQQLPPYGGPQLNEQPYGGHQMSNNPHLRHSPPPDHEELIPTAIVIKNIPFAVKKENLQEIMQNMNLPLPYAFNYHFDNGVFRGLAFANFTSPEETQRVISTMNQMELQGRKLRVEYKKMLPVAERDRIERDKRERRGQLQEQHQPINNNQLHNQGSMNSINSNIPATSPSPISQRAGGKLEFDLNDPQTLDFYTQLTLFKNDATREALVFPHDTTPTERRVIHTLAHHMGLEHRSEGQGDHRQVTIFRHRPTVPVVPHIAPHGTGGGYYNESRRGLNRAATVDFTENRLLQSDSSELFLRRQGSTLLDVPASPSNLHHQIRGAKSFADLRSFSPSPAPSTSSFPTNLAQNASRYHNEYHNPNPSGTPNLTPTSATGMNARDDLVSGMNSLGLRESSSRTNFSAAGPIGSQRPINGQFEETSRNGATSVPQRQPKGPSATEWSQGGFSGRNRQNGHINRGSDSSDRSAPRGAYM